MITILGIPPFFDLDQSRDAPESGMKAESGKEGGREGGLREGLNTGKPRRSGVSHHECQLSFSTWSKPSSTGVSRPKMDTSTVSFCVVGSTSEITAGIVVNGPSVTVTWSPTA